MKRNFKSDLLAGLDYETVLAKLYGFEKLEGTGADLAHPTGVKIELKTDGSGYKTLFLEIWSSVNGQNTGVQKAVSSGCEIFIYQWICTPEQPLLVAMKAKPLGYWIKQNHWNEKYRRKVAGKGIYGLSVPLSEMESFIIFQDKDINTQLQELVSRADFYDDEYLAAGLMILDKTPNPNPEDIFSLLEIARLRKLKVG